jgi:hypothetical protein
MLSTIQNSGNFEKDQLRKTLYLADKKTSSFITEIDRDLAVVPQEESELK